MDVIFYRFLETRQCGDEFTKFSIHQLCDLVPYAEEPNQWIPEDTMHRRLDIDNVTEGELAIQYLEFLVRKCTYDSKRIVTDFQDVYEDITSSSGHTNLHSFKESYFDSAAKATALERFSQPTSRIG